MDLSDKILFLCTRQKSERIKTGGNVISQTYQILLVSAERLRGKKASIWTNGQINPAVLSDGLRWYSGPQRDTETRAIFRADWLIEMEGLSGPSHIPYYPERGCRAVQWLCDHFPLKVDTYSEDWQAVAPRWSEPFQCTCTSLDHRRSLKAVFFYWLNSIKMHRCKIHLLVFRSIADN